ncbi:MAG: methylmalonyl-CoA mutase family protein [Xanthobacteraceae bacterium]
MTDAPDDLPLAAEFPPATLEQWRKLAEAVLAGARVEDRLTAHSADGLPIAPLYPRASGASVAGRRPGAAWGIVQRIDLPDPALANAEALHELENGANGLLLVPAGAAGAHGYGLDPSPEAFARALDGVHLDAGIAIDCEFSPHAMDMALALATLIERRGLSPVAVDIRFGIDPVGALALHGRSPLPLQDLAPYAARMAADLARRGFKGPFAAADGRIVHAAGGTEAQELAFVLAVAVAYLRVFEAAGIALDDARRMIGFRLTADADQFFTIAKFRALRKLWQRIEESCGLAPAPAFVAAETAWRSMTRSDPYANMLRATIAVAAGGIGGADTVAVLPFTLASGLPDRFSRRIARSTQLVLIEEANIARVADPTAGTGWSEDLTAKLCRAAWALFQELEAAGGIVTALARGAFQSKVAEARAVRERALAAGEKTLVGANAFRDAGDAKVDVLDLPPVRVPKLAAVATVAPLAPLRFAAPFEQQGN